MKIRGRPIGSDIVQGKRVVDALERLKVFGQSEMISGSH